MQTKVKEVIEPFNFNVMADLKSSAMESSQLSIIGAHGNTGVSQYFSKITDGKDSFPPSYLGWKLRNCGCVILAICNAGRSDTKVGTSETLGLASELLRHGVQCVIAPPWPFDASLLEYWIPSFIDALERGATVSQAMSTAAQKIKDVFYHRCAWTQLHLYGDGNFTLS